MSWFFLISKPQVQVGRVNGSRTGLSLCDRMGDRSRLITIQNTCAARLKGGNALIAAACTRIRKSREFPNNASPFAARSYSSSPCCSLKTIRWSVTEHVSSYLASEKLEGEYVNLGETRYVTTCSFRSAALMTKFSASVAQR